MACSNWSVPYAGISRIRFKGSLRIAELSVRGLPQAFYRRKTTFSIIGRQGLRICISAIFRAMLSDSISQRNRKCIPPATTILGSIMEFTEKSGKSLIITTELGLDSGGRSRRGLSFFRR